MNALEQRHRKRSANREAPARRGDLRVGTSRRGPAGAIVEAATRMLRVPEFFEETGYLTLSHRVGTNYSASSLNSYSWAYQSSSQFDGVSRGSYGYNYKNSVDFGYAVGCSR